jgi:hypothetical protein
MTTSVLGSQHLFRILRGRWSRVATIAIAALVALITLGLTAVPAGAATARSAALPTCTAPVAEQPNHLVGDVPTPDTTTAYWSSLLAQAQALPGSSHLDVMYNGADNGLPALQAWVKMVQSHCLVVGVNVGGIYQAAGGKTNPSAGRNAVVDMVTALGTDVGRYGVNKNDIGSTANTNLLVDAIRAHTAAKVSTLEDLTNSASVAASLKTLLALHGDTVSPAFFPWQHNTSYGQMSGLTVGGKAAFAANQGNAMGVLQGFDWKWGKNPKQQLPGASGFGFTVSHLQSFDVQGFAKALLHAGTPNLFWEGLEPRTDKVTVVIGDWCLVLKLLVPCGC